MLRHRKCFNFSAIFASIFVLLCGIFALDSFSPEENQEQTWKNDNLATYKDLKEGYDAGIVNYSANTIYLDNKTGNDSNDGLTVTTGVKSFAQALTLASAYDYSTISLVSMYNLTSNETWDFSSLNTNSSSIRVILTADSSYTGSIVNAKNYSLSLVNAYVDGGSKSLASQRKAPLFYIDGANGAFSAKDTYFVNINNTSTGTGNSNSNSRKSGVVLATNAASKVEIDNCFFNSISAGQGAALYVYGTLTVKDSSFSEITASDAGGAIWIGKATKANISGSAFDNTRAKTGGAIYNEENGTAEVSISNTTFNDSVSSTSGGVVFIGKKATATFSNIKVTKSSSTSGNGGAFYFSSLTKATLSSIEFDDVKASQGGLIYTNTGSSHEYDDIKAGNITTSGSGSLIYFNSTTSAKSTLKLSNGSFNNFKSGKYGGIFIGTDCALEVADSEFSNFSGVGGSVLYANTKTTPIETKLTNVYIHDGTTTDVGGAIFLNNNNQLAMNNVDIISVTAKTGGAVFVNGSAGSITSIKAINSDFTNLSTTTGECGAMNIKNADIDLSSMDISNNSAPNNFGGAVCLENATGTMYDVTMNNNTANVSGGALFVRKGEVKILDSEFNGNQSLKASGGAIFITSAKVTLDSVKIDGNKAPSQASAVMIDGTSDVTIKDSEILHNNTTKGIGAVVMYNTNCKLHMSGVNVIKDNTSDAMGGEANVTLRNDANNRSSYSIYVDGSIAGSEIGVSSQTEAINVVVARNGENYNISNDDYAAFFYDATKRGNAKYDLVMDYGGISGIPNSVIISNIYNYSIKNTTGDSLIIETSCSFCSNAKAVAEKHTSNGVVGDNVQFDANGLYRYSIENGEEISIGVLLYGVTVDTRIVSSGSNYYMSINNALFEKNTSYDSGKATGNYSVAISKYIARDDGRAAQSVTGLAPHFNVEKMVDVTNLDENLESQITTTIPPQSEVDHDIDAVFVIDYSSIADLSTVEFQEFITMLKEKAANDDTKINVGLVIFHGVAARSNFVALDDINSLADVIMMMPDAYKVLASHGTNMSAGLLAAGEMLAEDTSIPDSQKYVYFFSDGVGFTYTHNNDYTVGMTRLIEGFPRYSTPEVQIESTPKRMTPSGDNEAEWQKFFAKVGSLYREDYDFEYHTETASRTLYPINEPSTVEVALWQTNKIFEELAEKYVAYAVPLENDSDYDYGTEFMKYLSRNNSTSYSVLIDEMLYYTNADIVKSYVYNMIDDETIDDYHFDVVNDLDHFGISVNDTVLEKTQIDENTYGFGETIIVDSRETYEYVLTYHPETNDGKEYLEWEINVPMSYGKSTSFVYSVVLTDPKTVAGDYGYYGLLDVDNPNTLSVYSQAVFSIVRRTDLKSMYTSEFARYSVSYSVDETEDDPVIEIPNTFDEKVLLMCLGGISLFSIFYLIHKYRQFDIHKA